MVISTITSEPRIKKVYRGSNSHFYVTNYIEFNNESMKVEVLIYQIDQETKKETVIYIPVTFEKKENRVDVYLLLCDNTDVHKVLVDSKTEQQIHRLQRGNEAYITLKKAESELSKKVVEWNSTRTTLSTYQSRRRTASKFLKGVTVDEFICY